MDEKKKQRLYSMTFASVYPHYKTKIERKGRTEAELIEVIHWLTGYEQTAIMDHIAKESTFNDFFNQAPTMNPNAKLITGMICGYRVEEIEEPLHRKMRYLDKIVDELAKGKKMETILREAKA